MSPTEFVEAVQDALEPHRSAEKAAPMARYLRDQFPFLGLKRPEFQPLLRMNRKPTITTRHARVQRMKHRLLGSSFQERFGPTCG